MFAESSDSEPDAPSSGRDHRMSVLTKAKHEDLRETFDEEYDHYRGKRRRTDDSADGELSDSSTDETLESPPAAKIMATSEETDRTKPMSNAERMMAKMGYKEGKGLGKQKQGMVEPVALSTQRGRVGLGHEITKAVGRNFSETWDESKEDKTIEEHVVWLRECPESTRDWVVDNLEGSDWIQIAEVFDVIPDRDLREARTRANPYETIGGAFFQNRAAMKVANMDKVFEWLFSAEVEDKLLNKNPLKSDRPTNNCDRETPLFYFADVCAGPGGFSEYMLWRKAFYNAKGKDDFKLGKFTASSAYYFEPYYGKQGDGDVMNPENIDSLEEFIMKGTNDVGVDLMMADGGFSVEGQENIQEILSKRLYLCQLLVSLCIVKEGGVFFCKLFDVFTPFSAGLIYLMYVAYDQVTLHKPHTSRPANSERYIICKGLRKNYSDAIRDYLKRVNRQLDEFKKSNSSQDVSSIVPIETMRNDEAFCNYLTEHNERLAVRQSTYLQKYLTYAKNSSLIDKDQGTLRDDCLKYWLVPNKTLDRRERNAEKQQIDPDQYFGRFTRKFYGREDFNARLPAFTANLLTERTVKELKYAEYSLNILSNRATTQPELLISTGVDRRLETVAVDGLVRILDAAVINGDDVSGLIYSKRMEAAKKFCQALKLVVPKVRLGWGQHERFVVPPQLVTAEKFGFDQLAEVRRRFTRVRHSGEEVLVFEEHGHLLMCKAFRVARLLKVLDNYGPRVILENDSHKSGPTVNSVMREVADTDEQCQKT
ncbi:ribosomal RNA large subunit methyltransferase J [Ancylostoma ceylanicum]|uniref:Cap-specific mRNA (nucleoside-2'-O-)-methyltransferase 1 n=1 Tax=Ancylostoma ceylanicum TaxID=53326 RepID=A0A0D6M9L0_9BILA|nr:ribosomal RNA large subunit methyltransferase J [Ancylostoma ceylanicum]